MTRLLRLARAELALWWHCLWGMFRGCRMAQAWDAQGTVAVFCGGCGEVFYQREGWTP